MDKIKVLLLYIVYPLAMGTYFRKALERNPSVELKFCGPYTGNWIPWMGGMTLPQKYAVPPDVPLPFHPNVGSVSWDYVKVQLGDWKPDFVLCVDAGINWTTKPDVPCATIGTDPHVLDYSHARSVSDKFFNMQRVYSLNKDIYLPYAYDPTVHYPDILDSTREPHQGKKDTDAVLIGMPYENRVQWVNELRRQGISVIFENSPVFDEYRGLANRARIGLNWSSMDDLNARFFETPAFGLAPVMNRVSDASLFLEEDKDYLGFSSLGEAVEKVVWLKNNPDEISRLYQSAHEKIAPHTYDARIEQVLSEFSFG